LERERGGKKGRGKEVSAVMLKTISHLFRPFLFAGYVMGGWSFVRGRYVILSSSRWRRAKKVHPGEGKGKKERGRSSPPYHFSELSFLLQLKHTSIPVIMGSRGGEKGKKRD